MKVLVAIDSSPFAYPVVKAVAARIWPANTEFRVITLVNPCADWDSEKQYLRQAEIILDERVAYLRRALPKHHISSDAASGAPAKMIISAAVAFQADLIVLGSHGDTGIRNSSVGSVAAAVVNEAPCTVELVKVSRITAPVPIKPGSRFPVSG